jgi:putative flippase GtrA
MSNMKIPGRQRASAKRSAAQLRRFVIVGIINSLATYGLYLLLNFFVAYEIAYTISFAAGILISARFNASYTFKTALILRRLLKFAGFYILNYCLGLGCLAVFIDYLHWHETIAPIFVLMITGPIGFLGSKYVFGRKTTNSGPTRA